MLKNFIILFFLIFLSISVYTEYPSYKDYITRVLLWSPPITKKYNIGKDLSFDNSQMINSPLTLINTLFNLDIIKIKSFINNNKWNMKINTSIIFNIWNEIRVNWKEFYYNKIKKIIYKVRNENLGYYWTIINIKYKKKKRYKKEGDLTLRLSDLLKGDYEYIYIKTNKNYIIDINFNKLSDKEINDLKILNHLFNYLINVK